MNRQMYVFLEILAFLTEKEKVALQLVSKKFYNKIVPYSLQSCSI